MNKKVSVNYAENQNDWNKALSAFYSGDLAGALFVLKKIARERPTALLEIGNIYELGGGGVDQDFSKAKKWYEKSVQELDDPKAHLALGRLYFYGHGVERDYKKAHYHFSLLEEEDEAGAIYALGLIYQYGLGVEHDLYVAAKYYQKASEMGHLFALRQYGLVLFKTGSRVKGLYTAFLAFWKIIIAVLRNAEDPRVRIA